MGHASHDTHGSLDELLIILKYKRERITLGERTRSESFGHALTAPARTETVLLREVETRTALDWADLRAKFIAKTEE